LLSVGPWVAIEGTMTDTTETETPIRRIVVGTDFSEPSYPALKAAASTARREGATVFLAHVIDPLPHIGPGLDAVMGTDALREGMEEYAKQHLKELRESTSRGSRWRPTSSTAPTRAWP
jgi:nucleotide-binding universal stress UspA family protein